ncbi:MAG: hypothetical protein R3F62_16740, partial [Planctomycetota bacterium]
MPNPASADTALFVLPPTPEPTKEQVQAYGKHLGLELYDARLRLNSPLPRVLRVGEQEPLEALAASLVADGVPAVCLPRVEAFGHGEGWHELLRVREIERQGDAFVFRGRRLSFDGTIVVDPEPYIVGPDSGGLLVHGRYEFHASDSVTVAVGPEVVTDRATVDEKRGFAHLYLPGQEWAFQFVEDELDYGFLGAEKGYVARINFQLFVKQLAELTHATSDILARHASLVGDSVPASSFLQIGQGDASALTTATDSEAGCHTISRLLRRLWASPEDCPPEVQRAADALLARAAPSRVPAGGRAAPPAGRRPPPARRGGPARRPPPGRRGGPPRRPAGRRPGPPGRESARLPRSEPQTRREPAPAHAAPPERESARLRRAEPPERRREPEPEPVHAAPPRREVSFEEREAARRFAQEQALRGHDAERIRRRLINEHALAPHQANVLVDEAMGLVRAEVQRKGKRILIVGGILLLVGLVGIGFSGPVDAPPDIAARDALDAERAEAQERAAE